MADFAEGQTAVNPETKQRIVFQGGAWKPLGAEGVMADTKADQESLTNAREAAKKAEWIAAQADEFMKLNTRGNETPDGSRNWAGTGGLRSIGLPWGGGTVADLVAGFDKPMAEMKVITSRAARQMRVPGEGASSDKDVMFNMQAFPNITTPGDANEGKRQQLRQDAAEKARYAEFADQWYAKNGTLLGADAAFRAATAKKKPPVLDRPLSARDLPRKGGGFKYLGPE